MHDPVSVPSSTRLTPLQLSVIAASAGIGWGVVMALVAFVRDGSEIVLLQGWIFAAAWFFGRAAREPRAAALAGFAVVAGAVWTYELLPGWGLEAALRREGAPPADLESIAARFDADDVVLLSTLAIGALIGLGGALQSRGAVPAAAATAGDAPAPIEAPPPPPPLWAGFERPRSPVVEPVAPPPPPPAPLPPEPAPPARARLPWGSAFLLGGLATDFFLGRVFDLYSGPQNAVALGFLAIGLAATAWFARRHAIAMALAAAVLGSAFAAVQHAEYQERRPAPETALVR